MLVGTNGVHCDLNLRHQNKEYWEQKVEVPAKSEEANLPFLNILTLFRSSLDCWGPCILRRSVFFFLDKFSLFSPGWPRTHNPPASASWVLGFYVWPITSCQISMFFTNWNTNLFQKHPQLSWLPLARKLIHKIHHQIMCMLELMKIFFTVLSLDHVQLDQCVRTVCFSLVSESTVVLHITHVFGLSVHCLFQELKVSWV
jgi:hypothetical protein